MGIKDFVLTDEQKKRHIWRGLWLTAMAEGGGKFGAVQSYDGAGISAGLEHKIGVYPRSMKQAQFGVCFVSLNFMLHVKLWIIFGVN